MRRSYHLLAFRISGVCPREALINMKKEACSKMFITYLFEKKTANNLNVHPEKNGQIVLGGSKGLQQRKRRKQSHMH